MSHKEIAAFGYRIVDGKLKLLLVTNRNRRHWILPKGQPEAHLADPQVALLEAYEEGGMLGKLDKRFGVHEIRIDTRDGCVRLHVYVVRIRKLLDSWPENTFRKRKLVDVETALNKVDRPPLQEGILTLSKKIIRL